MQADFAAGTNVDVLYIDSTLLTSLGTNGQLLDLKPSMDQAGVKTEDFLGEMASLYQQDGKVYALPKDFGALALFVRNDMAEKAGIDPASIKTWDDWKNAAAKMTADGVTGQCAAFETERVGALWLQEGFQPIVDGKAMLTDPKAATALAFWSDLLKNKQAAQAKDVGAGWCGEGLGQGKFAMAMEGGWLLPVMANQYKDIKYTAIPLPIPTGGTQSSLVFTNGWGAAANTKYPQAAAALVLFLTSPQNQKAVLDTGFAMPTRASLLNDPYFSENPNAKVLFEAGQYGKLSDNVFGGPAAKPDVVAKIGTAALEPIFLSGADPTQSLEQANSEVQSVLDSTKTQ
jgi:multiple sugar transport system substrate-binding protein